jgi:putative addiction module killer protein
MTEDQGHDYGVELDPPRIEVLQTERFRHWMDNLTDHQAQTRITVRLVALQAGHLGDWAAIGGNIFELRLHFGPGYRIYFTYRGNATVILLAGGDKQSQRRDIDTARRVENAIRQQRGNQP